MKPSAERARRELTKGALWKLIHGQPASRAQLFRSAHEEARKTPWQIAVLNRLVTQGYVEKNGDDTFSTTYRMKPGNQDMLKSIARDEEDITRLLWPSEAPAVNLEAAATAILDAGGEVSAWEAKLAQPETVKALAQEATAAQAALVQPPTRATSPGASTGIQLLPRTLTRPMLDKLGQRIRELRREKEMTQEELAAHTGLHAKRISRAELGDFPHSSREMVVRAIATAFGMTTRDLCSAAGIVAFQAEAEPAQEPDVAPEPEPEPELAEPEPEPLPAHDDPGPGSPAGLDYDAVPPAQRERVLWEMVTYILASVHDMRGRVERLESHVETLADAWK